MRKDWEVKKLGDVAISDLGKTLNKSKDTGVLLPYLCSINVQWNKIDLSTQKVALFEDSEINKYSVKKGDLLVCEGGDIGRAAIWNEDYSMLYQNALHRMRFNKNIIAEYVLYFLWRLKRRGVLDKRYAKGVTIKHLVKSSLLSINIPVPPLQTQQLIVEEFDCLISIIEKQKKQLEELDNLAQSIFYDMFGNPIENEKGWNVKTLGELCKTSSGGTPSKSIAEYFKGDIFWLRSGEIKDMYLYDTEIKISDFALKKSSAKIFPVNTVVVAMYGATVGQVGIIKNEMATNQAVCGIFVNNEILSEIYLYYSLKERRDVFLSAAIGGGQPNISQNIIRNTLVSLPPLSLQQQFAAKIEAIEKQKELIKKSIKETEDLFNSRMDYYFN